MNRITSIQEYFDWVEKYRLHGVRSNDYIQQEATTLIEEQRLFVEYGLRNVFFFVQKEAGLRMYYYLNDLSEKANLDDYRGIVTEILFRSEIPQDEVDYFLNEGFKVNLVRDQYAGVYKDLEPMPSLNVFICPAATLAQVEEACELFNDSFDHLSGDFISVSEYDALLQNQSIWIALDVSKHTLLGALHQTKERGVNWISHVAVKAEARGQKIGLALVQRFIDSNSENEKTRYMLWVQRQNEPAVAMYKRFGFKYMNKSTLSLIK